MEKDNNNDKVNENGEDDFVFSPEAVSRWADASTSTDASLAATGGLTMPALEPIDMEVVEEELERAERGAEVSDEAIGRIVEGDSRRSGDSRGSAMSAYERKEQKSAQKKRMREEEEEDRRVNERMRIIQEKTLKDAEETRERDRKEAQRKLDRMERMELEEEEDIAVIEDNDFVITGPSAEEWGKMGTSGWGGPAKAFKDVRIKDAQREFDASSASRKVILSSERVMGAEGGIKQPEEDKEEEQRDGEKKQSQENEEEDRCTSYEEDEGEDEEKEEEKEKQTENKKDKEPEEEMETGSEGENDEKWGEALEDLYEGTGYSIMEDAETVAQYANEGGFDIASKSQNVTMVAELIRKLRNFREGREREDEGESEKEKEKEETESRRERKREKETDRKNRSRSRKDTSVEKRAKRPSSRQVRNSSPDMEDE